MSIRRFTQRDKEEIRRAWTYDPATGELTWARNGAGGVKAGDRVGRSVRRSGHENVYLRIDGRYCGFVLARVAWFLHHGDDTHLEIDHVDRDPQNNRIANLRTCTRSENNGNRAARGIYRDRRSGKWHAQVQKEGKVHGRYGFDTPEAAKAARDELHRSLFGSFSGAV